MSSIVVLGPRHDGSLGETDPVILARRQKQIDYGKNSTSYINYVTHIPKESRFEGCPKTPDRYRKASRRGFDSIIRKWKIDVHGWSNAIDVVERRRRFGDRLTIPTPPAASVAPQLSPPPKFCFPSPRITTDMEIGNPGYNFYRHF